MTNYPKQIKYIVGNEACERFSFYGMRSILVVFMTQHLLMAPPDAKAVFHLFVSACYLLPLLGAFISDRYLGKYRTILYLSIVYCVGHAVLAIWENKTGLYFGLGLIALGSGGIKPCVSAHVGDQFTKKNQHLIKGVFDIFYWSVNFGSFFSTLLIPWILPRYGASVAFGIPGILMAVATVVFWMGRKFYVHVPPSRITKEPGFAAILWHALTQASHRRPGAGFFSSAEKKFGPAAVDQAEAVSSVIKVYLFVSFFWALFDQHSSSWVLQATKMKLEFMGTPIEASQMAALNPILVLILIPIFSKLLYPAAKKLGFSVTPLRKIGVGMFVTASSFVAVALIEVVLDRGHQLSVAWQFIPYLLITAAEVMVSITGLEFAYTQAPRAMKSTVMSFWLMTVFLGNLFTAYISKINVFDGPMFFFFFAALMVLMSFIFLIMARGYKTRNYLEKA